MAVGTDKPAKAPKAVSENGTARKTAAVPVTIPIEFKAILEAKAKEQNTTVAGLVRNTVANAFGYTLPPIITRDRGKYAGMSAEDKKNAIANEAKATRNNVKQLLAKMEQGGLTWDQVLARFGPGEQPAAPEGEVVPA